MQIGYCGNVHPGRTIEEVKQNLTKYSLDVKSQVSPRMTMGIGLWLSETAARELDNRDHLLEFRDWLAEKGLLPFTLNGFPYGDFHQEVVKHEVYRPNWADPQRLEYTLRLAEILNVILPKGVTGTISTLPLAWPTEAGKSNVDDETFWKSCSQNLITCAERLEKLSQSSGRNFTLCIEPEPGCILDTCDDVIAFFDQWLVSEEASINKMIRNQIGVCHDVCHSAVMFEEQAKAISQLSAAEIRIGKVQISSAVAVDFDAGTDEEKSSKLAQLKSFAEPRYLHQTSVRIGEETSFFEDLPLALEAAGETPQGNWRVHFHVPIYSETLGTIGTTQADIRRCVKALEATGKRMPHFEIETYAWNVLPQRLKEPSLANGIAKEIAWFDELVDF